MHPAGIRSALKKVDLAEDLPDDQTTLLDELFTEGAPIAMTATKEGHLAGVRNLSRGWDSPREDHQTRYLQDLAHRRPFCVMLAFPEAAWSPLSNLADGSATRRRRLEAAAVVRFAVQVALAQTKAGRHFVIENPERSAAWTQVPGVGGFDVGEGLQDGSI